MTTDQPGKQQARRQPRIENTRMSLVKLVTFGTVIVTAVGISLFLWLAWLLARQPLPLRGDSGWWDWLGHVDGAELFDAARTTATVLAIVGVGGAALVAYRRQDTAERAHAVAIEGQQIANAQHILDSQKYELDRSRHELEVERRKDDRERELRARFTTIAEQLGAENFAVRHAGAYGLAALADDWHQFGNDVERQVCVDLICAQLRSPREHLELPDDGRTIYSDSDTEVRKTLVALIRTHRSRADPTNKNGWHDCSIDLTGAELAQFDLSNLYLAKVNLDGTDLRQTDLSGSDLANSSLRQANLENTDLSNTDLTNASLGGAGIRKELVDTEGSFWMGSDFTNAQMHHADLTSARLPYARFDKASLVEAQFINANLVGCSFNGANLHRSNFRSANATEADFTDAEIVGATFRNGTLTAKFVQSAHSDTTTEWPKGFHPY
ncbi:pentapeptide repeat-containing protein [Mycolicibacterium cosmeticum]|uniref:pentapeptide repeat-containing protein n=1 Tax=Mycolicibacterium cosmeticum TaxID=258533 RepID=UPI0032048629